MKVMVFRRKSNNFALRNCCSSMLRRLGEFFGIWKGARVAEEARLESVYSPKGNRGFESPSFRRKR